MKPNYNFFDVMKFMYANEPNNFREFVALTQKRHKTKISNCNVTDDYRYDVRFDVEVDMSFEYLEFSKTNQNGIENCVAYENFALDERGIWTGTEYILRNNHKRNTWEIEHWTDKHYLGTVERGKEETLSVKEFIAWLEKRNVKDGYMSFLRANADYVKRHPGIAGEEFL